jgi:hypothetical protein
VTFQDPAARGLSKAAPGGTEGDSAALHRQGEGEGALRWLVVVAGLLTTGAAVWLKSSKRGPFK